MQGYVPESAGGAFARSRVYYAEIEEWLSSAEAAGLRRPAPGA
jgi:hypothetical protein